MSKPLRFNKEEQALSVLNHLEESRIDLSRCKFRVKVKGRTIAAHRGVLMAASNYFKRTLSENMQETILVLDDADFDCVKKCVDFMYGKKVIVHPSNFEELMRTAKRLELLELYDKTERLMIESVDSYNCIDIGNIAASRGYHALCETCGNVVVKSFVINDIRKNLHIINFDFLRFLLKFSKIKLAHKNRVKLSIEWVQHDLEKRKYDLKNLLKVIDLELVSLRYRKWLVDTDQLIRGDWESFQQIALSVTDSGNVPYSCVKHMRIMLFNQELPYIKLYDPFTNTVSVTVALKCDVECSYSVTTANEAIYVLCENKTVHRLKFAPAEGCWVQLSSTKCPHGFAPPAVVLGGKIFVVGGWGGGVTSRVIECYDELKNTWSRLPDKLHCTSGAAVLRYGRYIYTFGGRINDDYTNLVEKYEWSNAVWVASKSMPTKRGFMAATEWNGHIIVCGGCDATGPMQIVEIFTIRNDEWSFFSNIRIPRWGHRIYSIGKDLYIVGGGNSQYSRKTIEKYDRDHRHGWVIYEFCSEKDDVSILASLMFVLRTRDDTLTAEVTVDSDVCTD